MQYKILSCSFHHTLHPMQQRKHGLLERYQFTCKCQACSHDFPLFENLHEHDKSFDDFISKDLDELENFNRYEAKHVIEKYSKYINEHIENFPCYEISLLQECILRCFRIFEKCLAKSNINFIES